MNFVLCFIVMLFIIVGFCIGKKYTNRNLFCLIFGFVLFEFILKFLPMSYDILSTNFHDATFIYIMLSVLLGVIAVKIVDSMNVDNKLVIGSAFYLFVGFVLFSRGLSIILVSYAVMNTIIGMYVSNNKKSLLFILFTICSMFGGLLYSFGNWMIGYILGFMLGIIGYYIISMISSIIKNKEKSASILLVVGMIISFIGVLVK